MTSAIDAASNRAIEAAEGLPRDHVVWSLWGSTINRQRAWDAFYKKCGDPSLDPNTEAAKIAFYEGFANMCERFVAGGDAARTEEMHLRELLDEALKSSVVGSKLSVTPNDVQRAPGPSVAELLAQPFDPAYRARRGLGEEGFGG